MLAISLYSIYIYLSANFTVLERCRAKLIINSLKNKCSLFASAREQKDFFRLLLRAAVVSDHLFASFSCF